MILKAKAKRPRPTGNPSKSRRLFCPTSQACGPKIYLFPKYGSYEIKKPSRPTTEGRSANRHDTLGGMRWTLSAREMMRGGGRSSRVVLSPRRWGQVDRDDRSATVAIKPDTPGRARSSRKEPSCRECRIVSATCSDYACGPPTLFCPRGCGCASARHSLRPLVPRDTDFRKARVRYAPRECGGAPSSSRRAPDGLAQYLRVIRCSLSSWR